MGAAVGTYVNATFATLAESERRELARLLDKLGRCIVDAAGEEEAGR
jgi:hypothetical protein